jgi:hypothetical protein
VSEAPNIQKTKDYAIFKKVDLNRDVDMNHVKKLKRELEKENNLHLKPIICNADMEVISGQHRLEAAKQLGLDIYYIRDPNVSYEFILNDNSVQKSNSLKDVVDFWAKKDKKKDYIDLQKYMLRTRLSVKALMGLLFGTSGAVISDLLRSGKFIMPTSSDKIEKIVNGYLRFFDYCHSKKITPLIMFTGGQFTAGFRNLIIVDAFNEDIFYRKLDQKWFDIRPQINATEWTRLLLGFYNFKNHQPIPEDIIL